MVADLSVHRRCTSRGRDGRRRPQRAPSSPTFPVPSLVPGRGARETISASRSAHAGIVLAELPRLARDSRRRLRRARDRRPGDHGRHRSRPRAARATATPRCSCAPGDPAALATRDRAARRRRRAPHADRSARARGVRRAREQAGARRALARASGGAGVTRRRRAGPADRQAPRSSSPPWSSSSPAGRVGRRVVRAEAAVVALRQRPPGRVLVRRRELEHLVVPERRGHVLVPDRHRERRARDRLRRARSSSGSRPVG